MVDGSRVQVLGRRVPRREEAQGGSSRRLDSLVKQLLVLQLRDRSALAVIQAKIFTCEQWANIHRDYEGFHNAIQI